MFQIDLSIHDILQVILASSTKIGLDTIYKNSGLSEAFLQKYFELVSNNRY